MSGLFVLQLTQWKRLRSGWSDWGCWGKRHWRLPLPLSLRGRLTKIRNDFLDRTGFNSDADRPALDRFTPPPCSWLRKQMYTISQTKTKRWCRHLWSSFLSCQSGCSVCISLLKAAFGCDLHDLLHILTYLQQQVHSFCVHSISMKQLKALLPLINYKAPNSRSLKEKLQVFRAVSFTTASLSGQIISFIYIRHLVKLTICSFSE